ncbi:hypothetical protein Aco03nite_002910 [Actinoplanes couchii]|uniref:Uncharacterized protein n=1 Tax=Actinoplanes couchii TaxID=403638 RepID=A0ABQ3X0A2_9ACTN|nr:hypothetical protein Aco03nite_002910 [Actinoplanes couchii]
MKAVLSGETCTVALSSGQPEPFTDTTSITIIRSGLGAASGAAWTGADIASAPRSAVPAVIERNMRIPPVGFRIPFPGSSKMLRKRISIIVYPDNPSDSPKCRKRGAEQPYQSADNTAIRPDLRKRRTRFPGVW